MKLSQKPTNLPIFFLRMGIGTVFLYAAFSSFLQPSLWVGYLPAWLQLGFTEKIFLFLFALYEVILSLWLFSPWKTDKAALLSTITLSLIIIVNISFLDVVFRDLAIFFSSLALFQLTKRGKDGLR